MQKWKMTYHGQVYFALALSPLEAHARLMAHFNIPPDRPPVPDTLICCKAPDVHSAADEFGNYVECASCGAEYCDKGDSGDRRGKAFPLNVVTLATDDEYGGEGAVTLD